jgi:hypothetical protein
MSEVYAKLELTKGKSMILIQEVIWADDPMFDADVYLTEKESD